MRSSRVPCRVLWGQARQYMYISSCGCHKSLLHECWLRLWSLLSLLQDITIRPLCQAGPIESQTASLYYIGKRLNVCVCVSVCVLCVCCVCMHSMYERKTDRQTEIKRQGRLLGISTVFYKFDGKVY
jgi:hypothetical protein